MFSALRENDVPGFVKLPLDRQNRVRRDYIDKEVMSQGCEPSGEPLQPSSTGLSSIVHLQPCTSLELNIEKRRGFDLSTNLDGCSTSFKGRFDQQGLDTFGLAKYRPSNSNKRNQCPNNNSPSTYQLTPSVRRHSSTTTLAKPLAKPISYLRQTWQTIAVS